jgi:hypothetical protein
MVVVIRYRLDHRGGTLETGVGTDEDHLGSGVDEPVDEVLG